jgi:hypothetical protein
MKLEDMLTALGNIDGHGEPCEAHALLRLNSFEANAIAAALRAGQEMRDKFNVFYDARDEFYFATKVDFIGLGESGKNWDAATKGG